MLTQRVQASVLKAVDDPALAEYARALAQAIERIHVVTRAAWATGEPEEALANATPYLQAFGHVVLAWMWLDVALCVQRLLRTARPDTAALHGRLAACRYFFRYELPRNDSHRPW